MRWRSLAVTAAMRMRRRFPLRGPKTGNPAKPASLTGSDCPGAWGAVARSRGRRENARRDARLKSVRGQYCKLLQEGHETFRERLFEGSVFGLEPLPDCE